MSAARRPRCRGDTEDGQEHMKKPIWAPGTERVERANLSRFVRFAREQTGNDDLRDYAAIYDFSIHHPERFWPLVWEFCGVRAVGTFHDVVTSAGHIADARWFPGVRLNFAQNLLRIRDERCALTFRDATGAWQVISYAELHQQVARVAGALRAQGLKPGDIVTGLLRNGSEAVVAMLASVAVGAVWSALAPDTSATALRAALKSLAPRLVFVDAAQRERVDDYLDIAQTIVVGPAVAGSAADARRSWAGLLAHDLAPLSFELAGFDQPLYALCRADGETSLHSAGGTLIQHLKDLLLHVDLKREDRVLHAAVPGNPEWYWLTSALAAGSTLVLAGDALDLDDSAAWDLVDEQAISVLATDTGQLAAFAASSLQPRDSHKLLSLRTILATGAAPPPAVIEQIYARGKERMMLSVCGGDGGGMCLLALGCPLLPVYTDELQCRSLGMNVQVLDGGGNRLQDEPGDLACLAPFPGLPLGWLDDAGARRFRAHYFSRHGGAWCCGEQALLTAHDGLRIAPALETDSPKGNP
jgi:acetoacetyl-CoA synthetase